ncbi:MAG: FxLYD domain-containing protein [Nitrososphaerales archaeon]
MIGILLMLPAYGEPNIRLFNYSSYTDINGSLVVVGEVVNDGREAIRSVEVKATFFDVADNVLGSGSTLTPIEVIPPGQRAPFMIIGVSDYAFNIKSFELQVVQFTTGPAKPAKLEIVSTDQFSDGIAEVRVKGEILNTGDKTASTTKVYATFYDERNNVVGFASIKPESETIAPNTKTVFEFKVSDRVPLITSYTLYADSEQFSSLPYGLQSVGNPIEIGSKVSVSRLSVVDQQGTAIGKFAPNERAWIGSDLTNKLSTEQEFAYIVQIKNNEGFPVEIKWIDGILEPNMSVRQSISWTPDEEGIYFAEIFVWRSMDNPMPLTTSIKTIILLVSE